MSSTVRVSTFLWNLCFHFHFMCLCMCILGHDEREFLTMAYSPKNFERFFSPYFILQTRVIYLSAFIKLHSQSSVHAYSPPCLCTCVSLPRMTGPPLCPLANFYSKLKTHLRCFLLCVAFHGRHFHLCWNSLSCPPFSTFTYPHGRNDCVVIALLSACLFHQTVSSLKTGALYYSSCVTCAELCLVLIGAW